MKLPISARNHFSLDPESFSPASKIRLAEEWSALVNLQPWHLRFDCSLVRAPKNDIDVIPMMSSFLSRFSTELRAKQQCSGLRWQGVYVPEPRNPKTLEANPHVHGLIRVFRKGGTSLTTLSESLISAGNADDRFKSHTWLCREIGTGENPSSYFTGHTGSDFLVLTRGADAKGFNV